MTTRRQTIKLVLSFLAGLSLFGAKIGTGLRTAYAAVKRTLLPRGASMSELKDKNPADLDTHLLETTPMDDFNVMGQTTYPVDIDKWRLELTGDVEQAKILTYGEILQLPTVERNVLLICPGFFAYNGLWKGVSSAGLLSKVVLKPDITHVEFSGPEGIGRKTQEYTIQEVMTGKVFLAYQVNGRPLPEKHGFPLRLVAEDYYGGQWVKYVNRVSFVAG
jgi:DMSO/TMAO reductase YedYZ molybdopterin-dependent catalytic subunit